MNLGNKNNLKNVTVTLKLYTFLYVDTKSNKKK